MSGVTNLDRDLAGFVFDIINADWQQQREWHRDLVQHIQYSRYIRVSLPHEGVMWIEKCNEWGEYGYAKIVPTLSFYCLKSRDDGVERIATILAAQDWVWI